MLSNDFYTRFYARHSHHLTNESWDRRRSYRCRFDGLVTLALISLVIPFCGCNSTESKPSEQTISATQETPKVSQVPLRIWITAGVDQPEILIRQWLSNSEQPIEVTTLSEAELLLRSNLPADVLLAPTRLLGELLHREWIVKLPDRLLQQRTASAAQSISDSLDDSPLSQIPPGLVTATSYAGVNYGLPLGHSMNHLLGSPQVSDSEMTWELLASRLDRHEILPVTVEDSSIDRDALVDRFLAIAIGLSPVNAKYGVLFEIRSMKARLTADEFLFAARLLQKMASQHDSSSSVAVTGSHRDAWNWIHHSDHPAYALISVSGLDTQARSLEAAHWIPLVPTRHWNDGAGLMATMPSQCRQTAGAIRFIQWICGERTLADLQDSIPGLLPLRNTGILLADRIAQKNLQVMQDQNLVCEPRIPRSGEYRSTLANHLLSMLRGERTAQEALAAAAADWDQVTEQQRKLQQMEYEKSLGLTL
jgi:hypothetical protein